MKKFTKLLSLLLVFVISLGVVACSSYSKVEKALEDIGYSVVENSDKEEEYKDDENVTNVHVLEKSTLLGKQYVVVLEFKSTKKLVEYFEENEELKTFVQDIAEDDDVKKVHAKLEEAGLACDNCLIFSLSLDFVDVMEKIAELNK